MNMQRWSLFALLVSLLSVQALADNSEIEINGEKAQVYFNDGDTFRIITGKFAGKRSRLQGFNTLESYGAIQRWGTFTKDELLKNAHEATFNARRGGWHCTTDLSTDMYGRILSECMDLALDQIGKGFAHVMTIDKTPGNSVMVAAQHKSIEEGNGMWAKGVPEYIVSSLHSMDEKPGQRSTYNRFVSTRDGHSVLDIHQRTYSDCDEVCVGPAVGMTDHAPVESCMVYVNFKNRFGPRAAGCLRQ